MREKILKKLAHWHTSHPWRMLLVVVFLILVLGALAGQLTITMRTSDLLPESDPKVVQFNKIIDEFTTATNLVVVVQPFQLGVNSEELSLWEWELAF